MKKTLTIAFMFGLMLTAVAQKFAVVDMQDLIRLHPDTEKNKKLLETTLKEFEEEQSKRREQVKELGEAFEKAAKEFDDPALSEKAKVKARETATRRQRDYMEAERALQDSRRRRQQELSDQEMRMIKLTTDNIREKVEAFAKAKSYDAIFASQMALFTTPALDVTDDVLKSMNIDPALRKLLDKPAPAADAAKAATDAKAK